MLSTSCATLRDQQVDEQKPDAQQPGEKPADKRQVKRPASSQPENWVSEVERRQLIEKWEIRGRLGFQTDTNQVTLYYREGTQEQLPVMDKQDLAHVLLDRVIERI